MDKKTAYSRLLREDPETAAFLQQVAEVFRKPAAMVIRFNDGSVFSTGQWGTT